MVSEIPAGNGKTANLFSQCKAEKTCPVQYSYMNVPTTSAYVVVPYQLTSDQLLNLKLSSGQQSHFSDIWWACGALMFLLEPRDVGNATWGSFTV